MVNTELALALGWNGFMPDLVVKRIAVPLTQTLLEALLVGYFVLRVAILVQCDAVQGGAARYQCAASVLHRGPIVLFFCTLGSMWACVTVRATGRLLVHAPGVHVRELQNRD
jgi:hypothetical protein